MQDALPARLDVVGAFKSLFISNSLIEQISSSERRSERPRRDQKNSPRNKPRQMQRRKRKRPRSKGKLKPQTENLP
jgi:hypothetical protein